MNFKQNDNDNYDMAQFTDTKLTSIAAGVKPEDILKTRNENKICKGCKYFNRKKVVNPPGAGMCDNRQSKLHLQVIQPHKSCSKFDDCDTRGAIAETNGLAHRL